MLKFAPLVWASLVRKPLRTTLTTLSLVTAFVLFGLLQGINTGLDAFVESSRMDRVFVTPRYGAPMPIAYKEQIAQLPGITSLTAQSFISGHRGDPKDRIFVGAAEDEFFTYFSEFNVTPAQIEALHSNPSAIIISQLNADRWNMKVGDRVTMQDTGVTKADGTDDWEFELVAIIDRDDIPGLAGISVGNLEYINQGRTNNKDMVNEFLLVIDNPDIAVDTARTIDDMFINSAASTRTLVERLIREAGQANNNISTMVNSIVAATLFALLLLTSNSMMQSFRERTRELGTLKALGFSDRNVLWIILAEAAAQCLIGSVAGLLIARLIMPFAKTFVSGPANLMTVPWSLIAFGIIVSLGVALFSAAIPAWRAGRLEVAQALTAR